MPTLFNILHTICHSQFDKRGRLSFQVIVVGLALILMMTVTAANSQVTEMLRSIPSDPVRTQYNQLRYSLYALSVLWTAAGLILLVRMNVGSRLETFAQNRARSLLGQSTLVYSGIALAMLLWESPISLASVFIERSYGFYHASWARWLMDRAIGFGFSLLTGLGVWAAVLAIRKWPRQWPCLAWAGLSLWIIIASALFPVIFAPAFNRFVPLPPGETRTRIEALAHQAGVDHPQILVADSSRRTKRLNGYVAGIGSTQRIVIWDNALNKLPPNQLDALMAHELGHYALGHVWWNALWGSLGTGILLGVFAWIMKRLTNTRVESQLGQLRQVPLALLVLHLLQSAQLPIESAISRRQESQADRFAVQLMGTPLPLSQLFVEFAKRDYSDPNPPSWAKWWFYSHPPIAERIRGNFTYPISGG